ncbi:MAG: HAMP domain-containing histidine kinase [Solirubrobacteraceae bacterium]|nr:HAMP domain-containing histidine kinase [Solirubrobacteraceae bacterium]
MNALGLLGWAAALALLGACGLQSLRLRQRRELVTRACHELRNPLTAARLMVASMQRGGEVSALRLDALDRELRRAAASLDDLAAARVGRTVEMRDDAVEVGELVEEQLVGWQVVARAFGSDLRVGPTPAGLRVRGDRVRLAQALSNLVANALEHGSGPVDLAVRRRGSAVHVEVADQGPGLPAPVDVLTRRRRRGQRGRGLAIADQIARSHGGRVATAPAQGGARVALELPACEWPA